MVQSGEMPVKCAAAENFFQKNTICSGQPVQSVLYCITEIEKFKRTVQKKSKNSPERKGKCRSGAFPQQEKEEKKMKRNGIRTIAEGNWLSLAEIEYTAQDGKVRTWESVSRRRGRGAVGILARLNPTGEILFVRQYRPPVNRRVIEFPAGLIDDGESPAEAAVRELREETGFIGTVTDVLPPSYSSPGLTSESIYLALMDVDLAAQGEIRTDFDEGEFVETYRVAPGEIGNFLRNACEAGDAVDSKVMAYACASGVRLHV